MTRVRACVTYREPRVCVCESGVFASFGSTFVLSFFADTMLHGDCRWVPLSRGWVCVTEVLQRCAYERRGQFVLSFDVCSSAIARGRWPLSAMRKVCCTFCLHRPFEPKDEKSCNPPPSRFLSNARTLRLHTNIAPAGSASVLLLVPCAVLNSPRSLNSPPIRLAPA